MFVEQAIRDNALKTGSNWTECHNIPSDQAHWEDINIKVLDNGYRIAKCRCSKCGSIERKVVNEPGDFEHFKESKFCSNCGVKMCLQGE